MKHAIVNYNIFNRYLSSPHMLNCMSCSCSLVKSRAKYIVLFLVSLCWTLANIFFNQAHMVYKWCSYISSHSSPTLSSLLWNCWITFLLCVVSTSATHSSSRYDMISHHHPIHTGLELPTLLNADCTRTMSTTSYKHLITWFILTSYVATCVFGKWT